MQDLVHKLLQMNQGYSHGDRAKRCLTIDLAVWRNACYCPDLLGFLKGDFFGPLEVYVASLVRVVD